MLRDCRYMPQKNGHAQQILFVISKANGYARAADSGMGNLFSANGHLGVYKIIHGLYKNTSLKISLLQIYWVLSPACTCLAKTGLGDFMGLIWTMGQMLPTPNRTKKCSWWPARSCVPDSYLGTNLAFASCIPMCRLCAVIAYWGCYAEWSPKTLCQIRMLLWRTSLGYVASSLWRLREKEDSETFWF